MANDSFSAIPQIQRLLETEAARALCDQYSRQETISALRQQLDSVREQIKNNEQCSLPDFSGPIFFEGTLEIILHNRERSLKQVINATGIILHTNLGRAPMAEEIIDAIRETALGYSNLEYNINSGKRGSRYMHVEDLLRKISGAEAAVVVNNCAAAVLVTLNTLAKDHELIVSRGELIEIGGGFRMPDVISATGAIMKEVGTTNKTRISDYQQAINENTKVILSNHCSNYQVVGFTESPDIKDLAELAHNNNLSMVYDLGSGAFIDLERYGIQNESSVQQIIKDGVDVVTFSGDKLLGGPQAGIILGNTEAIAAIKKNPLLRALRIDKLSLAALEVTLGMYLVPELAVQRIPILKMMSEDESSLKKRAKILLKFIENKTSLNAWIEEGTSYIGGGSAPMNELPTTVVKISSNKDSAEKIAKKFRKHKPAIVGRITDDAFVIDLRTVGSEQVEHIKLAIESLQ